MVIQFLSILFLVMPSKNGGLSQTGACCYASLSTCQKDANFVHKQEVLELQDAIELRYNISEFHFLECYAQYSYLPTQ